MASSRADIAISHPKRGTDRAAGRFRGRAIVVAALVLAILPLLLPAIPPLTDVPGHIGRYHVMLAQGDPGLARWYSFEWRLVPNLGADLIVLALAPFVGLFTSVKLVALAIPLLTVGACLWLSRTVHGRISPIALLAVPLAYNQPFQIGFLNYTLAMAGAIAGLACWLRLRESPSRVLRTGLMAVLGILLWLTHAFGWASLLLAVFAVELHKRIGARRRPWRWLFDAGVACLPLAPPLLLMLVWRSGSGGGTHGFLDLETKLLSLATILRDRWAIWDLAGLGAIAAGSWFAVRNKWVTASPLLLWCAGAWAVAFLALPKWLFGSALADTRLAPYALLLALLAFEPVRSKERAIGLAIGGFVLARVLGLTLSLGLHGARMDAELAALNHLPSGVRLVSLVSPGCNREWGAGRLDHLGSIALATRDVFTNDQWSLPGAPLVTIRPPAGAAPFAADPSQYLSCGTGQVAKALARIPGSAFDYVWIIGADEVPPGDVAGFERVWVSGTSALYRIEHGAK